MGRAEEEDRILRIWTPLLLRTILIAAMIVIGAGLILAATAAPGYYVGRYRAAEQGHLIGHESFSDLATGAMQGNPHVVMTIGLFVLTLVPLVRVAFCFLLFLRERDYTYVALTAYVLAGLLAGVVLGRIG
jgi:uncharacterized membrane protein